MRAGIRNVMTLTALALASACAPMGERSAADVAAAPASVAAVADGHAVDVETWRQGRLQRLQKADGWLSLIGLHWLLEGEQSIGSAPDNAIVLNAGPAHLGVVRVQGAAIEFAAAEDGPQVMVTDSGNWRPDGDRVWHTLAPDTGGKPSLVSVETISFLVIERGGKFALRVRDSEASTRRNFPGIEHFPVDASWRIEAAWTAHPTMQHFDIQNVIGTIEKMENPGYATFVRDGREFRIYPVIEEGSEDLFIIFADRTSGRETYGPGRFVYAAWPKDGTLIIDFNKAYNPPCAFSEYSTCPLPPPENRLDLKVTAGEKKFIAPGH